MSLVNVLVADDHEVTRRGLREILSDEFEGVDICDVSDFKAFLAQLNARPWDLILLDILMPGANVTEAIRKTREVCPTVPILIVTALTEIEYVFETMQAGANGLIHKHRASDELVFAIKKVMGGETYLHPETAVDVAGSLNDSNPSLPHRKLSERELEIFRMIAVGKAVKSIAGDLGLSDKTVATYLMRIREKTGLQTYVDIARYALQHRLVD